MKITRFLIVVCIAMMLFACNSSDVPGSDAPGVTNTENLPTATTSAAVTSVTTSGVPGSYTFTVTISSPDTGCEQYADWWEVFRSDGSLAYRRILLHSHVDEQPFTRSGGPVDVLADEQITIRAHMNNLGYGTEVFSGTITQGLIADSFDSEVALDLALAEPLPDDCAF